MKLTIKVNPAAQNGPAVDEVFVTSEDPYVNRVIYAKPGLFKEGELTEEAVAKLEAQSKDALEKEHAAKLAREAKEREAAEVKPKAETKKEG